MAAEKLASSFVEITLQKRQFEAGLEEAKEQMESTAKAVNLAVFGQMAASAAAGTSAIFKGLRLSAGAESFITSLNTVIKDMERSKDLMRELDAFSVVTPFEPTTVREAGKQLVQAGFALDNITNTIQVLGDLAAGGGKNDLGGLTSIFVKITNQGKLTGETLEQMTNQGINMRRALMESLGVSADELAKMQAKGEITPKIVTQALKELTSEGGMFYKAMIAQSVTFNGLWSTIVGGFDYLLSLIGDRLMPMIKAGVTAGIEWVNWAVKMEKEMDGIVSTTLMAATAMATWISAMKLAKLAGTDIFVTLRILWASSRWAVWIALVTSLAVALQKLYVWLSKQQVVIAAWNNAAFALGKTWEQISGIFQRVRAAGTQLYETLGRKLATSLGVEYEQLGATIAAWSAGAIARVTEFVQDSIDWIIVFVRNWQDAWEAIRLTTIKAWNSLWDLMPDSVGGAFDNVVNTIRAELSIIYALFEGLTKRLKAVWDWFQKDMSVDGGGWVKMFGIFVGEAVNLFTNMAMNFWEWMQVIVENWGTVVALLISRTKEWGLFLRDNIKNIPQMFMWMTGVLADHWIKVWHGLMGVTLTMIRKMFDAMIDHFSMWRKAISQSVKTGNDAGRIFGEMLKNENTADILKESEALTKKAAQKMGSEMGESFLIGLGGGELKSVLDKSLEAINQGIESRKLSQALMDAKEEIERSRIKATQIGNDEELDKRLKDAMDKLAAEKAAMEAERDAMVVMDALKVGMSVMANIGGAMEKVGEGAEAAEKVATKMDTQFFGFESLNRRAQETLAKEQGMDAKMLAVGEAHKEIAAKHLDVADKMAKKVEDLAAAGGAAVARG